MGNLSGSLARLRICFPRPYSQDCFVSFPLSYIKSKITFKCFVFYMVFKNLAPLVKSMHVSYR